MQHKCHWLNRSHYSQQAAVRFASPVHILASSYVCIKAYNWIVLSGLGCFVAVSNAEVPDYPPICAAMVSDLMISVSIL